MKKTELMKRADEALRQDAVVRPERYIMNMHDYLRQVAEPQRVTSGIYYCISDGEEEEHPDDGNPYHMGCPHSNNKIGILVSDDRRIYAQIELDATASFAEDSKNVPVVMHLDVTQRMIDLIANRQTLDEVTMLEYILAVNARMDGDGVEHHLCGWTMGRWYEQGDCSSFGALDPYIRAYESEESPTVTAVFIADDRNVVQIGSSNCSGGYGDKWDQEFEMIDVTAAVLNRDHPFNKAIRQEYIRMEILAEIGLLAGAAVCFSDAASDIGDVYTYNGRHIYYQMSRRAEDENRLHAIWQQFGYKNNGHDE